MKRVIILVCGIFISAGAFASLHHHKAQVDTTLNAIHKVYVKGNNEAAIDIRREMLWAANKYGDDACFAVVGNEKAADAVLEVSEQEHSSTRTELNGATDAPISTMVATGTLTDVKGNLLWSDSKQNDNGPLPLHSRRGWENLLRSLYHRACGSMNGDRK